MCMCLCVCARARVCVCLNINTYVYTIIELYTGSPPYFHLAGVCVYACVCVGVVHVRMNVRDTFVVTCAIKLLAFSF